MEHELITYKSIGINGAFDGACSCSDADYDDGWYGEVGIYGVTEQEIQDWHHDHLVEAGEV